MSNDPASEPSSPPSGAATQGMPPSRIILFSILGILIVALAYDFLIARRGQKAAAAQVEALMAGPSGSAVIASAEPVTHEQVLAAIGMEPSSTEEGPTYYMETFCWRSGLPWRTHDLYVIYTKSSRFLHDFSAGQEPGPNKYPRPATAATAATPVTGTATAGAEQSSATRDRAEPPPRGSEDQRTQATGDRGSEEEPAKTAPQPEPAG